MKPYCPAVYKLSNQPLQYAACGRRTPFSWLLRRHSKGAAELSYMDSPCGQATPFDSEAV
ncbi:hypothetical protein F6453_3191 [Marinobacter nauticus]|uniref:Uncharacterized protein n=1 Tax=Marinobacter nauticus TaxID=2743 RepID=A0A833JMZ9_MARNT|nr:hypothetical protein F6453_3191 [Marinobacter nauticus]